MVRIFEKITDIYKINNVDFLIYTDDTIDMQTANSNNINKLPIFIMSKDRYNISEADLFLLPDIYLINDDWIQYINRIKKANKEQKWENKINKIFWRGNTTGNIYNLENFSKLPRLSLVILSNLYPDLIDADFVRYMNFSNDQSGKDLENIFKILSKSNVFNIDDKRISEEDHLKYISYFC